MNQKFVKFQVQNGYVKLCFTKENGVWVCKMPEQTMSDLEACLDGKNGREFVRWMDLGGLGD